MQMNRKNYFIIPFVVCMLIFSISCGSNRSSSAAVEKQEESPEEVISYQPKTLSVTYRISGTAKNVAVTYNNGTGGIIQQVIRNNQSIYIQNVPNGSFLSISAFSWEGVGIVKVDIIVNGKIWKTATARGSYGSVSLSGNYFKLD